jgi:hypothetical protein
VIAWKTGDCNERNYFYMKHIKAAARSTESINSGILKRNSR